MEAVFLWVSFSMAFRDYKDCIYLVIYAEVDKENHELFFYEYNL